MTTFVLSVLMLTLVVMSIGVLWVFGWAVRDGQMKGIERGAQVIFDAEEQVGVVTDVFPDKKGWTQGTAAKKGLPLVLSWKKK